MTSLDILPPSTDKVRKLFRLYIAGMKLGSEFNEDWDSKVVDFKVGLEEALGYKLCYAIEVCAQAVRNSKGADIGSLVVSLGEDKDA